MTKQRIVYISIARHAPSTHNYFMTLFFLDNTRQSSFPTYKTKSYLMVFVKRHRGSLGIFSLYTDKGIMIANQPYFLNFVVYCLKGP